MKSASHSHAIGKELETGELTQPLLLWLLVCSDISQLQHGSNDSGGDTDTLGPLPGNFYGGGPGWSSDDQLSLPPYDAHAPFYPNPMPLGSSRGAPSTYTQKSGSRSPGQSSHEEVSPKSL